LDEEFKFADELLVEQFVQGAEITVPVINATALEAIEIVSPSGFYDWDAKYVYNNGQTEYFCPPRSLPENVIKLAKEYALKFYHAAGCRDILRVDFIVDADGVPRVLEGNSLPGNTDHSLVPKAARHAGISMEKMAAQMVYCAMKRSDEPPMTMAADRKNPWGTGLKAAVKAVVSAAAVAAGAILLYAGAVKRASGSSGNLLLIAGGLLIVLYALFCWADKHR